MRRKGEYLRAIAAVPAVFAMIANTLASPAPPENAVGPAEQCRFIGWHKFDGFQVESTNGEERVLVSPVIKAPMNWNELLVTWNAGSAASNSWVKLEARGIYPDHQTKYYTLGLWSPDNSAAHPRQSVRRQKDTDGDVKIDTLILNRPGADAQARVTLGAKAGEAAPELRFMGFSFLDSHATVDPLPSDRRAWGKIIPTPEKSQDSYPEGGGWCSPTSLSMTLERWSGILGRPEMKLDVPEVAAVIDDSSFGTGNWVFNMAFAGSFPGMRAYATRLSDLTEVEAWIEAGIPVGLSARWNLLSPGRKDTGNGHLVVCIGFTESGDVVINDPASNLAKGQQVRHIYTRANVINAWRNSHNTVYLIYPEEVKPPASPYGHWDQP